MIPKELEKALFTGVGMIVVSREKARHLLDQMVKEAKLSAEDAEKLLEALADSGHDQWASLKNSVREAARRGLNGLDEGAKKGRRDFVFELSLAVLPVLQRTVFRFAYFRCRNHPFSPYLIILKFNIVRFKFVRFKVVRFKIVRAVLGPR